MVECSQHFSLYHLVSGYIEISILLKRIEQVGSFSYLDSTGDCVGMFTFHMRYTIAPVFIPWKREADGEERERDEFQSLYMQLHNKHRKFFSVCLAICV